MVLVPSCHMEKLVGEIPLYFFKNVTGMGLSQENNFSNLKKY